MIYVEIYTKKNYILSLAESSFKEVIVSIIPLMDKKAIIYDFKKECLAEIKIIEGEIMVEYLLDLFNAREYFTKI